jgi:hypothetical protein
MRRGLKPRNCAELQLVDEMAVSHWRKMRAQIMESAVYDRQRLTYRPLSRKSADGEPLEPLEDMLHLAEANSPELYAALITALGRLETRYYRQYASAFRLLLFSQRGTPPPASDPGPGVTGVPGNGPQSELSQHPTPQSQTNQSQTNKEPAPCSH